MFPFLPKYQQCGNVFLLDLLMVYFLEPARVLGFLHFLDNQQAEAVEKSEVLAIQEKGTNNPIPFLLELLGQ